MKSDESLPNADGSLNKSGDTLVVLQDLLDRLQRGEDLETVKTQLISRAYLRLQQLAHANRLRIGSIDVVHLPGKPFVEFQLYAQEHAAKNAFVCVAGYGECGVWYYGPDHIFTDRGGYEQTWSLTGPCQREVESGLRKLLAK